MGEHRDRVGRPEADLVGELVRPPDQEAVDIREPRLGRERRPAVDDHGLVAQLLGQPDQRARDLDRPDDDEARTDRVRLDEQLVAGHLDRPRHAVREGVTRRVHEGRVGGSVAQRALELAVFVDHQDVGGFRARPGWVGAERRRGRVRGQRRDDCATVAATLAGLPGRGDRDVGHAGRDQHVDGPAAGEPHVPRLLVADPVADDALVAALARRPDLLRRSPLDASPGHGAREPPVVGHEQDRTLGPRRRAERPHHDGAADARALRAPPVQRVQQLLHRDLRFVGRAFADQPQRRRARGCRSRPARSIM